MSNPTPKLIYVSIDIETTGLDPNTCQVLEVGAVIDDWRTPVDQLPRFRRVLVHDEVHGNPYAMWLNSNLLKQLANVPKGPVQLIGDAVARWAEQCAIKQDVSGVEYILGQLLGRYATIHWYDIPNTLLMNKISIPAYLNLASNPPGTSCFCTNSELGPLFRTWLEAYNLDPMDMQAAGKNFASFDMQFLNQLPGFSQAVKFRHRVLDPAVLYWKLEDDKLPDSKTCYERAGIGSTVTHTAIEDALAVVRLIRTGIKNLKG